MAKTTLFKGVVYLSDEQYNKLITDGVIEVGGQTITYDESMMYVTPKALPTDYYTKSEIDEKLSQTISKPLIARTATEIVAVDNTNSQTMLAIGDGLSVENGTLKASGGSKVYMHSLDCYNSTDKWSWKIVITNTLPEIMTIQDILDLVNNKVNIPVVGYYNKDETNRGILYYLTKSASVNFYNITYTRFSFVDGIFNMYPNNGISNVTGVLTDTVTEL